MIKSIPLNKLVPSPRNVRRRHDEAADAELKASITARGLLQNLVVRAGKKGQFEVEAGERRRRQLVALAAEKVIPRYMAITCLVIDADETEIREVSLAENFHRLAMNPADEAQAFASIIETDATVTDVARRFGLTVRFVEGRLRLASLAPVVFEALAAGEITLDIAKAYGATSDQAIQTRVFEQVASAYYGTSPDSIRRMVLNATVTGSDPRARLVGRDAYVEAGGRIDRELFDDDESESWTDIALLEQLASAKMEELAKAMTETEGVAWVKPTLDVFVTHEHLDGLQRVPVPPAPLSEADVARIAELDDAYDAQAAILEDEESDDDSIAVAEAEIEKIDAEAGEIRNRPPILDPDIKREIGMFLTLGRDGAPVLQPHYFTDAEIVLDTGDDAVEVVTNGGEAKPGRAAMSRRLVDELAMQRRDILALHVASDPGLALDIFVFMLADADTMDWRSVWGTTIRGPVAAGPVRGFEAKDASASVALADLRGGLDESWKAGETQAARFDLFRALGDDMRASWLGFVVARTLEASLNTSGQRAVRFHDHLGCLTGIDMAAWWRPTAANFFDRVSKAVILDALKEIGGTTLSSRFSNAKKGDLAASAERIFAGNFITEVEVKERALAWVPVAMTFAAAPVVQASVVKAEDDADAGAPAAHDASEACDPGSTGQIVDIAA
jgi:ParB family chromosome partitioning protein